MKVKQRQLEILNLIRKHDYISVEDLADRLAITRETIRQDLTSLSNQQKILKKHGGASLPQTLGEGSFQQRLVINGEARQVKHAHKLLDKLQIHALCVTHKS